MTRQSDRQARNIPSGNFALIAIPAAVLALLLGAFGHAWWLDRYYESGLLGPWSAGRLLVERNEYGAFINNPLERPEAWRGYAIVLLVVMHLPGLALAVTTMLKRRMHSSWLFAPKAFVLAWYVSLLWSTTSGKLSSTSSLERTLDYANEIVVPVARSAVLGAVLVVAVVTLARRASRPASRGILLVGVPLALALPFVAIARDIVFG